MIEQTQELKPKHEGEMHENTHQQEYPAAARGAHRQPAEGRPSSRKRSGLVLKMPETGEDHRQAAFVSRLDDFVVAHGATGLDRGGRAGLDLQGARPCACGCACA